MCLSLSSYSQPKPSNVNASESRTLTGTICPLDETQTFIVNYPEKLKYWDKNAKAGMYGASLSTHPLNMKAKRAKKGVTPDFNFNLITSGIGTIDDGTLVDYPGGGVVVEFKYTFPFILQVTDKEGNVVKNFEFSNDETVLTTTVHPYFMNEAGLGQSAQIPTTMGFVSKEATKVIADKMNDYLARIEYNTYYEFADQAMRVITNGYGFPKISYVPVILEVNKKEKTQYAELNAEIDKLKSSVDEVFQSGFNDNVKERLTELGKYFESNLDDSSSKDAQKLYAYNAALAYLLGGSPDEAYTRFLTAPLAVLSKTAITFNNLYPLVTELHYLHATKDDRDVTVLPIYTVDDRKKMEKEALELAEKQVREENNEEYMQALAARNVNKVPGYVVTKSGEKMEGLISMKFVELERTQIMDTDIAKLAWVYPEKGKSKAFRTKDVSYIVAGDKRFEPVTVYANVAIKALGALAGSFGSDYFMEVMYINGGCIAYYDPAIVSAESYYVKCLEDDKVVSFSSILKTGKASEKFFGNSCPEIQERVKTNEFEPTKEGLVLFVNALADCVK